LKIAGRDRHLGISKLPTRLRTKVAKQAWIPAVENQPTDRAFRIGQTKNILVQKEYVGAEVGLPGYCRRENRPTHRIKEQACKDLLDAGEIGDG
jgi:hypothetical protein